MQAINLHVDQDLIDEVCLRPEFAAFFERVLGRSVQDCLLTDESTLSDFVGSGVDAPSHEGLSYREYLDAWDAWALTQVRHETGLALQTTNVKLIVLADLLRARQPTTH